MSRPLHRIFGCVLLVAVVVVVAPAGLSAQALPTPKDFVSNLDLRCYRLNDQPPLNLGLNLTHLNPVLSAMALPVENVVLGKPTEFCAPVFKQNIAPPNTALPFLRYVDLKCYDIQGPPLNVNLALTHLNPSIVNIFGANTNVVVREPQQLCVPVRKNNQAIPAAVLQLIQWIDLKCYRVDAPAAFNANIQLHHLNPLWAALAPQMAQFQAVPPNQLCVPVAKNGQIPPATVLPIVQYSDVLCYRVQAAALNQALTLRHLNPLFVAMGLQPENVVVGGTTELCVPVAKNGNFPPG